MGRLLPKFGSDSMRASSISAQAIFSASFCRFVFCDGETVVTDCELCLWVEQQIENTGQDSRN